MSDRKATDILLSIEQKVQLILGHNKNQDLLMKTLLNRLQALEEQTPAPSIVENVDPKTKQQLPGLKPGVRIGSQITRETTEVPEEKIDTIELESKPTGQRRDLRYVPSNYDGKPIPVQQKLLYEDGRAIVTAQVEILSNGNLVKSLKTNATGKWTNTLNPGTYTVRFSKKATSTQKAVEAETTIDIPVSQEPVQLKPFQVGT